MNGKKILDAIIFICSCAVCATSYYYLFGRQQLVACTASAIVALVFLILLVRRPRKSAIKYNDPLPSAMPAPGITEAVLLNEDDEQIATWDLFGKVGVVIGRDVGENHVNINLSNCTYASMIDVEHAILNHAADNWYIEDVGSKNGVSVMKAVDGKKYRLAAGQPCLLQPGDIVYIAMTRLLVR